MHSLIYHISKFRAQRKYSLLRSTIYTGLAMQIILGLIITLGIFFLSDFIASTYLHTYPEHDVAVKAIQVLALGLFAGVFLNNISGILLGFQKIRVAAIGEFFRIFLWFLFTVIFIYLGYTVLSPALGFLCAYILIAIAFSGIVLKLIPKGRFKTDRKVAKELCVYGFPIMISLAVGYIITYTDNIMVTFMRGLNDASLYQTAQPITTILWFFSSSVITALFPIVTEMKEKKSKGLKEGIPLIYRYVWLAIIPAALIMFSFSAEILGVLFGPAYVGGSNVLKILSIGAIVFSITQINGTILNAIGKPEGYRNIVIKGAMLNVAGNLILIPILGIEGAAISTLASYMLMLVGSHLELRKELKVKFPVWEGAKTIFAGLVGVVAIYATKSVISASTIVKIGFGFSVFGIVFVSLVLAMGVVNLREIYRLIQIGFGIKR